MKPDRALKNIKAWDGEGISDGVLKLFKKIKGKAKKMYMNEDYPRGNTSRLIRRKE